MKFSRARRGETGFVLVLALVVVVIMTLSAVAMIVSLRGGISASGNIAFRQAATRTADVGVEGAYADVQSASNAAALGVAAALAAKNAAGAAVSDLNTDITPDTPALGADENDPIALRYYATFDGAVAGCKKDGVAGSFRPETYDFAGTDGLLMTGAPCAGRIQGRPAGYAIYYVVHRMAKTAGLPCPDAECLSPTVLVVDPNNQFCHTVPMPPSCLVPPSGTSAVVYYRITVKVSGPRQNNRYIQAFVY